MLTTRLTFDLDSDVPKLFFSNVEFLDVDTHNLVIEQGQSAAAINAGKLSFKKKGETAASAEMPKLVAPAGSAAAKVKAAEAAKPEAKPAAKPKAAEPAPAKDTGLSTLVDEWGDDQ